MISHYKHVHKILVLKVVSITWWLSQVSSPANLYLKNFLALKLLKSPKHLHYMKKESFKYAHCTMTRLVVSSSLGEVTWNKIIFSLYEFFYIWVYLILWGYNVIKACDYGSYDMMENMVRNPAEMMAPFRLADIVMNEWV